MSEDAQPLYPTGSRRVRDVPERERPRELFDRLGPENVPDSVLVAILLRTGVQGLNVMELADVLLSRYGSLTALAKAPMEELMEIRGISRVKAQILKAALQLARNMVDESAPARRFVRSPEDAAAVLRETARTLDREVFWVLLLDRKNGLRPPPREVSKGILDASIVHPREVFRPALQDGCASVILAHNHPSGDPTPSAEDIKITRQLVEAGRVVEIDVVDHVVLGRPDGERKNDFVSLREAGLVEFST